MKCIAVTNEKGGVAKTTTAVNLGAALAEMGHRVLLIDMDAQANLTLAVGADPQQIHATILDIILDNVLSTEEILKPTGIEHLHLLGSNSGLNLTERLLPRQSGYETLLQKKLPFIGAKFDYVILDCPPFLGALMSNALAVADIALIPTQAEYFSIYALKNILVLIRRIREQHNPSLAYRLLLTMFDQRNRIHRTLYQYLREHFADGLMETVIPIDTRLRESAIAGVPVLHHAPKSRAALQYRALAQEIIHHVQETLAQPA